MGIDYREYDVLGKPIELAVSGKAGHWFWCKPRAGSSRFRQQCRQQLWLGRVLAGPSSGSTISRNLGGVEDAFDRAHDQPQGRHQAHQVEWNENKRGQVPPLPVSQKKTKFKHAQEPFDLDSSRAGGLPTRPLTLAARSAWRAVSHARNRRPRRSATRGTRSPPDRFRCLEIPAMLRIPEELVDLRY